MLTGLYPNSELHDESTFRMAEAYFKLGEYAKAESAYKKILTFSKGKQYHQQSRFKLGWSIFKLDRYDAASEAALETLDYYPKLLGALNIDIVEVESQDLVEDTLRLLAIIFSKQKNHETIETLQNKTSKRQYAFLLYDALFRFYLTQDRFEDAALITEAYAKNYPKDFNAYQMALNTIKTYKKGGFDILEWQAKESFVKGFGVNSPYWSILSKNQLSVVKPLVNQYLSELAHSYYVRMQKGIKKKPQDPQYASHAKQAASYYLELVKTNPENKENAQNLYLAAEALNRSSTTESDYLNVIDIYEEAAYAQNNGYAISVKAGYAAILSFDKLKVISGVESGALSLQHTKQRQDSIKRYAKYFPDNVNTPPLLNDLANELFKAGDFTNAQSISTKVVTNSKAKPNVLYSSWLVNAHSAFELNNYSASELAYKAALSFKSRSKNNVNVLKERLAASIYKQAEAESNPTLSADLYLSVVDTVPDSKIVPQALYDASSQFLGAKKYSQAIATLHHFQTAFPKHKLHDEASEKLIFAYTENNEHISAAEILVSVSNKTQDQKKASNYLYRAADLYYNNDFEYEGVQLYKQFISTHSQMFDLSLEAHQLISSFNEKTGNLKAANTWKTKLVTYEKKHLSKRTDRSAYLAANAAFSLAMRDYQKFEDYKLNLPLKKSLSKKKSLMTNMIKTFESLVEYEVAEVASASTYQIAQVYRALAQDLMLSERPSELNALQLEQYDILLEEQAYPFEEQALDIHKINIAKVPSGQYDTWIKQSYRVLEEMNPAEYKREFKEASYAESMY